eukprot:scaffold204800_cov13-Tisochrysis_lutea.AAC.1
MPVINLQDGNPRMPTLSCKFYMAVEQKATEFLMAAKQEGNGVPDGRRAMRAKQLLMAVKQDGNGVPDGRRALKSLMGVKQEANKVTSASEAGRQWSFLCQ